MCEYEIKSVHHKLSQKEVEFYFKLVFRFPRKLFRYHCKVAHSTGYGPLESIEEITRFEENREKKEK